MWGRGLPMLNVAPSPMSQPSSPDAGLFQAIVEHAVGPLLVIDPHGRVTFANSALASTLEVSQSRVVGRHLSELVHPEDVAQVMRQCLEPPAHVAHGVSCRLRSASGGFLYVEL